MILITAVANVTISSTAIGMQRFDGMPLPLAPSQQGIKRSFPMKAVEESDTTPSQK